VFDKFVPGEACRPGLVRRALNVPSRLLFTDLTRCLEPLVADSPFVLVYQEPSLFAGQFRIAQLRLAGAASSAAVDPAPVSADTLGGGPDAPAADA